jgi:hypothetical protein
VSNFRFRVIIAIVLILTLALWLAIGGFIFNMLMTPAATPVPLATPERF